MSDLKIAVWAECKPCWIFLRYYLFHARNPLLRPFRAQTNAMESRVCCWKVFPQRIFHICSTNCPSLFHKQGTEGRWGLKRSTLGRQREAGKQRWRRVFTDQEDYGHGGGKAIEETAAGVSWNDWAATKPIGEMRTWPKRHEKTGTTVEIEGMWDGRRERQREWGKTIL